MKTELIDVSPTRKEIKIEIEPAAVREAYDRISERVREEGQSPRLSTGPCATLSCRTRFKSEIRAEVFRRWCLSGQCTPSARHTASALGEPNVQLDNTEALDKFGEEPLSVQVNVEVLPEVELKDYKGLEVSPQTRPISDDRRRRDDRNPARNFRVACNRSRIAPRSRATPSPLTLMGNFSTHRKRKTSSQTTSK